MSTKISCGGFKIDGESIVQTNGVLSASATGLPDSSLATDGQILIVNNKEFVIGNIPSQLPAVTAEDKDKFLHTNKTTGNIEWAECGSSGGGGVLIVPIDLQTMTLGKTWQEIFDADFSVIKGSIEEDDIGFLLIVEVVAGDHSYIVNAYSFVASDVVQFVTDSADGYPAVQSGEPTT